MPGLVVLGMHRSGTSAVTRVLHLLGAVAPDEADLLTNYDNPEGHWESRTLVACNDRILGAFGRSWDFPPWLRAGWERSPKAEAMLPDLRAAFASVYPSGPWVWKDPRTCLTLPLWRRALDDDPIVVFVSRAAGPVTRSLLRRDGIPRVYGAGLWLHYLAASLEGARGLRTVHVAFDDLLRDPGAAVAQLVEDLDGLGLALPGSTATASASLRAPASSDGATAPDRIDALVDRLTARGRSAVQALPRVTGASAPPSFAEPRWVRPLLVAYRGPWVVRARLGYPLGPRFA